MYKKLNSDNEQKKNTEKKRVETVQKKRAETNERPVNDLRKRTETPNINEQNEEKRRRTEEYGIFIYLFLKKNVYILLKFYFIVSK